MDEVSSLVYRIALPNEISQVAQYKLAYSVLLTPVLMTLSVLLADRFGIVSWKSGTFILPAATWLSIRTLEDCFACVRSCMSLAKLVLLKKEVDGLWKYIYHCKTHRGGRLDKITENAARETGRNYQLIR